MAGTVTIYHNPDYGTSRNTLEMIRASGAELLNLQRMASPLRDVLRQKGTPYAELGWMTRACQTMRCWIEAHPILINRPR